MTLTTRRIARLDERALEGTEFINSLALEASRNQAVHKADVKVLRDATGTITGLTDRTKKIDDAVLNPDGGGDDKKKKGAKKK